MSFTVSMRAILDLAVKLEEVGRDFYYRIAGLSNDQNVKDICLFFASQEEDHIAAFKKIVQEENVDIERNFAADIVSLFNQEIGKASITGFEPVSYDFFHMTVDQTLDFALNMELATIAIYEEIKKEMDTNYDIALAKVIHEEHGHVNTIQNAIKERKPQEKIHLRKAKIIKPDKIIIRKIMIRPSPSDLLGVALIFVVFLGMIFAMLGPGLLSGIVDAILRG